MCAVSPLFCSGNENTLSSKCAWTVPSFVVFISSCSQFQCLNCYSRICGHESDTSTERKQYFCENLRVRAAKRWIAYASVDVLMGFMLWTLCKFYHVNHRSTHKSNSPQCFYRGFISNQPFCFFFCQPQSWLSLECLNSRAHRVLSMLRSYMLPEMNPANDHSATLLKVVLYPPVNVAFTISGYDHTRSKKRW